MKFATHALLEVLNWTMSTLLAQPTKKASYRDLKKNYNSIQGRSIQLCVRTAITAPAHPFHRESLLFQIFLSELIFWLTHSMLYWRVYAINNIDVTRRNKSCQSYFSGLSAFLRSAHYPPSYIPFLGSTTVSPFLTVVNGGRLWPFEPAKWRWIDWTDLCLWPLAALECPHEPTSQIFYSHWFSVSSGRLWLDDGL